jgi:hypothetical protein
VIGREPSPDSEPLALRRTEHVRLRPRTDATTQDILPSLPIQACHLKQADLGHRDEPAETNINVRPRPTLAVVIVAIVE